MKHERANTSRSTMQTHRLAIELNSSADLSKSTPDGDEDLFLRHGPSSRRPIRVTVEGRLAAATISMDGRQRLPLSCPSLLSKAIPAHSPRAVIEPGTASDGIRSSQGPLKLSFSTGKCTSARRDYGFESAFLRRPLPSNGKRAEMDSGTGSQVAFIVHRAGHGVIFALPRCSTHSKDTWRFRHGASVNSEEGGDPCFSSAV